ncbi:MAG: hypothetical protein U0807_06300 [Candidatus Binatia bacterium]
MHTLTIVVLLGFASIAAARLPERETPRATDLLRADHLAGQAKQRLQIPARKGRGWVRGGGGFGQGKDSAPEEAVPGNVRIEIRTPRRRPAPRE